jgi:hypothetical protein
MNNRVPSYGWGIGRRRGGAHSRSLWRTMALLSEARTVGDESSCTGQRETPIAGVDICDECGQAARHERNMVSHNRIRRAASQRLRGLAETAGRAESPIVTRS